MSAIIFNPDDLSNPQGSNKLTSLGMYYQRLLYKEEIYPDDVPFPLDTWYDKVFYGRVDRDQNTVAPKESRLKGVPHSKEIYALNFVADAFNDFSNHMKQATTIGVCVKSGNTSITNPVAHKGYEPFDKRYNEFLGASFQAYMGSISPNTPKITDLASFTKHFIVFLKKIAANLPLTLCNYTLTNHFNTFNTGLSISIMNNPLPGDDAAKYADFIIDPNFDFYVAAAKKFGFTVNKNMPWILTADLFTAASMKYISQYRDSESLSITDQTFFDAQYTKVCYKDIDRLRLFIKNSYEAFVSYNPYTEEFKLSQKCNELVLKSRRRDSSPPDITTILTDKYMIDLYLELRSLEAGNPVQITLKLKTELANIYKLRPDVTLTGLENAIGYINMIYRDYIYDVTYPSINEFIKLLDNNAMAGTISTVASIATELY
tara:strand:+ start:161 stop:1453 length:1293 start_codon:yes stop_codon:yes gene_type:complete